MLDLPLPRRFSQNEGAATQIIVADVEGDEGDIIERLNKNVLGVEPNLRCARGPNTGEHLCEGSADSVLADEPQGLMLDGEERRRAVGEEAHHLIEPEPGESS